ncbi:MAG TPA: (Fe-S)-binding protein [Nitrososphaerales archaeon]|nr:(Fe-S)-binding protein [Nitrososphaerales archaeon]
MDYGKTQKQLYMVRDVVYKNLLESYMPLPVDRVACSGWAKNIPRSGPTVLYTSYMYQLGSVFKSYAKLLERFSGVKFASRFASLGGLFVKPNKEELERASRVLNNIARLLTASGTQVAYLHEEEPYSGALLLELGLMDEFHEYGAKLFDFFKDRDVRRLVTVDPHTTNALFRLKEYVKSDIEVVNYLALVKPSNGTGRFVMHDSCLYSRYLSMGSGIRKTLEGAGVSLVEDRMVTALDTSTCCGAPVESMSEDLSERIAKARAAKLTSVCEDVLVACPLCYQNLSPYVTSIRDIAEVVS